MANSHLQDEGVAAGGFVRVYQADDVEVLESVEQIELLRHPVSPHQLLVHVLDRHRPLGAPLVAPLDHRETAPEEAKEDGRGHHDPSGCPRLQKFK